MTQRRGLLPADPSDLWRTVKRLERTMSERAGQLLTTLRRTDGSLAFGSTPGWTWYDPQGTAILAEDAVAGQGLALPYLTMSSAPARHTDWQATTSGSFEEIHRITAYKQQPYAYVSIGHAADVAATTGEVQVTVNGVAIDSPTAVAFIVAAVTVGPFPLPGAIRDQVEIRVQARRTGGAGNVRCAVLAASQIQA